jgi:hypothetical protein
MIVLLVKCGAPHGVLQKETSAIRTGYGRGASSYTYNGYQFNINSSPDFEAQLRSSGHLPCTIDRSADCPCLNSVLDQVLVNILVTALISTALGGTRHLQMQGVDTTVLVVGSPTQKRARSYFGGARWCTQQRLLVQTYSEA